MMRGGRTVPARKLPPSKDEIAALQPFDGLPLDRIHVPHTPQQIDAAWAELGRSPFVGFDTESKPTFTAGEVSGGPDVVQFATATDAWVFQLRVGACLEIVRQVLESPDVVKVGFGLQSDHTQLKARLGVQVRPVLDLDVVFSRRGYPRTIGVRGAMAVAAGRSFAKSKRVTTSNWSVAELQPRQLIYAANDAYAALKVFEALDLPQAELDGWIARRP
jgi:ribonuclease D